MRRRNGSVLRGPGRASLTALVAFLGACAAQADSVAPACDPDITLPDGFCAVVVADEVGAARHLVVAPNGDVFVALAGSRRRGGGGIVALRDTTGDGRADVTARFGEAGGTGIALRDGSLYFAPNDRVVRYDLPSGQLEPRGAPVTVVSELPTGGNHSAKSIALGRDGELFVNIGSPSNSCQVQDRQRGSPGKDPCPELETRAGIWRFDAGRTGQTQADGERYATGLRNAVAITVHPSTGVLYGVQHGRDQLYANWPELFTAEESAELPSEEFVRIDRGDDFGWPYCYHDWQQGKLVLAPEYGGDGQEVGRCADKEGPLVAFPGHWAPEGVVFYDGEQFPERYRGGVFITFHGSWNRSPLPQAGYKIAFVPVMDGRPTGRYETFADGFAGETVEPGEAAHRPTGLAVGPDGSLYVADDAGGRIWRIRYVGDGTD